MSREAMARDIERITDDDGVAVAVRYWIAVPPPPGSHTVPVVSAPRAVLEAALGKVVLFEMLAEPEARLQPKAAAEAAE